MKRKITKLMFSVLLLGVLSFSTIFLCSAAGTLSFTKQPADAVVYAGDTVTLSVSTTGGNTPTYQWYTNMVDNTSNGSKIPGATSNKYMPSTKYTGKNYFYCKVNSTGTTITINSETACVTVKALPAITAQPAGKTVYTGATATLSVTASGSGTLTYQWYSNTTKSTSNAVKIPSAVSPTYLAPTTAAGTTYYYCVVTNTDSAVTTTPEKSVTSSIVKVVVNALSLAEPSITAQPSPVTVYAGTSAKLSLTAAAGGTLSYQWYKNELNSTANSTAITGATGSSYQLPTDTVGTVFYYCVVTNTVTETAGSQTYQTASGIVACTVKAVTVITTQPTGTTAFIGDTVTLSVAAAGSGTLSYQWYTNTTNSTSGGSKISGAAGSSYTVPTKSTGTTYYYCIVTNQDNAITISGKTSTAASTAAQVIVLVSNATAPDITAQPSPATVYAGTPKKLTVTAGGTGTLSYQWYSNSENSTASATAITGAVNSTFVAVNTTAGTTYYYCVVTNMSETASGPEAMTATSAVVSMVVQPLPSIILQPADSNLFSGDVLTLSVSASGSGSLSYQWYKNTANKTSGTKISGATGSSYTVSSSSIGTLYYYCIVTNLDNSITDTTKTAAITSRLAQVSTVPVDADAPKITKHPASVTVMAGATATLTVNATGSGALSYQWFSNTKQSATGAVMISGATSSTYAVPTAAAGKVYYFCQVTNTDITKPQKQTATVSSNRALVTVNSEGPAIVKQPESVNLYALSSCYISVTAKGCGTLSYQWYSSTTEDNSSGTAIAGAVSARFLVPTKTAGTTYYYCVVTNTVSSSSGVLTGTAVTNAVTAVVTAVPSVTTQPADVVVNSGQSVTLSVRASGSGKMTYQWYSSTNSSSGKSIKGATGADYQLTTKASSATKVTYYYCVILVLDNSMTTNKKFIMNSNRAAVTVKSVNAAAPVVTSKPVSQKLTVGSTATLTVSATGTGTLSYQWYSNTKNSTTGATLMSGATSTTFTIPTSAAGTKYYYCVVTNTDNTMSGTKTASTTSSAAKITVKNS